MARPDLRVGSGALGPFSLLRSATLISIIRTLIRIISTIISISRTIISIISTLISIWVRLVRCVQRGRVHVHCVMMLSRLPEHITNGAPIIIIARTRTGYTCARTR